VFFCGFKGNKGGVFGALDTVGIDVIQIYSNSSIESDFIEKFYTCASIILGIFKLEMEDGMQVAEIRGRLLSDAEKLKAPEGYLYAGYPFFRGRFGRDGLIVGWETAEIEPDITEATLDSLAKDQATTTSDKADRQPGKILHTTVGMPGCEMPYFGSVDATPLFVIVAGEHFKVTGDVAFIRKIWPNIVAAVNWMSIYGDADHDHFLEYETKNPGYGCAHQGWKDCFEDHLGMVPPVAIVEAQGYAYAAYRSGAYLARQLSMDESLADSWLQKAEELREAFHKKFWWEKESFYYLGLDGSKKPRESVTSNPGHLLFTGILDQEKVEKVVQRLFKDDIWTPYGIRTLSEQDPDFDPIGYHLGSVWPHDNWIIAQGLKEYGFQSKYEEIKQALISAYRALGCMPECYKVANKQIYPLHEGPDFVKHPGPNPGYANALQAWALWALLEMIWND